jgi:Zn-dependent alcohol dehydrogenase
VGCDEIIGVDLLPSRLMQVKAFGATTALNTSGVEDLKASLKAAANKGSGPDVVIESAVRTYYPSSDFY